MAKKIQKVEETQVDREELVFAPYQKVFTGGIGEIEEKKSRFIATVRPVESEEEAIAFINEMKKKYWDAKHNCSAFVIGSRQELNRCSDDGEPAQTAGRPMLDVLLREGVTDLAVVVTRYFGGVLLGTGGLVRAYQKATQEGLSACKLMTVQPGYELVVSTDYNGIGKLQYIFGQRGITILDSEYGVDVKVKAMIPYEERDAVEKEIIEATSGQAALVFGMLCSYAVVDGQLLIL